MRSWVPCITSALTVCTVTYENSVSWHWRCATYEPVRGEGRKIVMDLTGYENVIAVTLSDLF